MLLSACKPKLELLSFPPLKRVHSASQSRPPPLSPLSLPPSPSLAQIKQAHARIIVLSGHAAAAVKNKNRLLGHLLLRLSLASPTHLDYPLSLYRSIEPPSVFASNNVIRCLARSDLPFGSVSVYASMRRRGVSPNEHTFTFVLQACGKGVGLLEGRQVHAHAVKLCFCGDLYVRNALIHLYCACSEMGAARRLFNERPGCRDVITWNSMVAGFAGDGQIDVAKQLFDEMPKRDVISWTALISGYVQNGQLERGLECFKEMRECGLMPNEAILVTVLWASAQLGLLEHGRFIHSVISSLNLPITVSLGTALVDMYAKCGSIELSRLVFDQMAQKNIWSWNAMICGLASHGLGREALALFKGFLSVGLQPASVTFVGVLNACSRSGLVREGRQYYKLMTEKYGIEPEMEHYGCMVDLLGRAGHIYEAVDLIENMKVSADPVLWATLLGACKVHGLVELGEKIGSKLVNLDPTHEGHYVQLSNIYAKASKWADVIRVRRLMAERNANKVAGWSLIEAQGIVHRFVAGDRQHELSSEIYGMLEIIEARITEAGYSPDVSSVLHDIGEEEKENAIKVHSERLAMAFGLLVAKDGDCIRIVKNLRVCADCHEVTKVISQVFQKEIVVRDGSRFHRFKDGACSCLDYW
ncbi:pentatricopeptide repeat-containing protein At3g62890-like [Rhodamnia argentea]|uniref:Pentatricopeptide repeat-containing protein At3g62890-like n=1 Tax=Rhodamnia argentea TaxID=178133 RepID=A0A8B8MN38_9MYRT|nr:pentatricopeptide repeat-containing protein At3g62890-like [Rhodamnia argentea]